MQFERDVETKAMWEGFAALKERWRLTSYEIEMLVGPECVAGLCAVRQAIEMEKSARILLLIDFELRKALDGLDVVRWLRSEDDDGVDPLTFMAEGPENRSMMLQAARARVDA